MKKSLVLVLAACLFLAYFTPVVMAEQAAQPASTLTSLTHNCPNTGIMLPTVFNPLHNTYLLTVASWVSRVSLTPVSTDPQATILINDAPLPSGQTSPFFEMTDVPQVVTISVTSTNLENSIYSVYLQRRPSNARAGMMAGYLKDLYNKNDKTYFILHPVTVTYADGNVASFSSDPTAKDDQYTINSECIFYYGTKDNPIRANNADVFKANVTLGGKAIFYIIYIEDEIIAVLPFAPEGTVVLEASSDSSYSLVTPAPSGDYITLREGDMGDMVTNLQHALKDQGYYTGAIDGKYGEGTTKAITAFQHAHELKQDGLAGSDTQRGLFEGKYTDGTSTPTGVPEATRITNFVSVTPAPDGGYVTLREGDKGSLVSALQQALKEQEYYTGKIDEMYGAGTTDAVTDFQRDHGLTQDGIASPDMQRILHEGSINGQ